MPLTNQNGKQWFFEGLYPDCGYGFEVSRVLYGPSMSEFQEILVLETPRFGRVLVLDDNVQFTECDERLYHEMMAHPAVMVTPGYDGKSVLVVGGGDGGIARELVKHADVRRIIVADIDPDVTAVSKEYFGDLFEPAFKDSRVTFMHTDAAGYIQEESLLDVVIVDSTDPIGVAEPLFGREFIFDAWQTLRQSGVFVRHAGSLLLQPYEFRLAFDDIVAVFGRKSTWAAIFAPLMYFGGYFTSISAVKRGGDVFDWRGALDRIVREDHPLDTEWYTPAFYRACTELPRHVHNLISERKE